MYGTIEQEPNKYETLHSAECSAKILRSGVDDWHYIVTKVDDHYQIKVMDEYMTFVGWM